MRQNKKASPLVTSVGMCSVQIAMGLNLHFIQ